MELFVKRHYKMKDAKPLSAVPCKTSSKMSSKSSKKAYLKCFLQCFACLFPLLRCCRNKRKQKRKSKYVKEVVDTQCGACNYGEAFNDRTEEECFKLQQAESLLNKISLTHAGLNIVSDSHVRFTDDVIPYTNFETIVCYATPVDVLCDSVMFEATSTFQAFGLTHSVMRVVQIHDSFIVTN